MEEIGEEDEEAAAWDIRLDWDTYLASNQRYHVSSWMHRRKLEGQSDKGGDDLSCLCGHVCLCICACSIHAYVILKAMRLDEITKKEGVSWK